MKTRSEKSSDSDRLTRSQRTVLHCLKQQGQAISAQDIYVWLRDLGNPLGLATVYRALDSLKVRGLIQGRCSAQGEALYSLIQEDCHHLTCVQCGRSVPLEGCPVRDLTQYLQETQPFKVYYHTLEFFGLCEPCHGTE